MANIIRPLYKKWMTRSQSLIDCQLWYRGDRYSLPEVCDQATYYTPLFIYRPNKAVAVYYDHNDFNQNPDFMFNYFAHHPEVFDLRIKDYREQCNELLKITSEQDPANFDQAIDLYIKSWGMLTALFSLANKETYKHSPALTERAYEIRSKTDWISYKASTGLVEMVQKILPPNIANYYNFVTIEEVSNRSWPSENELAKRQQGYYYFQDKLFSGLKIEDFIKTVGIDLEQDEIIKSSKITGSIACKGIAQGVAKIVFEHADLNKVQTGDILITSMTTPDYLPAMQKAAAFVTDEGGITCHAAIVAREICKPCVIGTKIATEIFKDGDLVEVDANKGIVRISEK